MTKSLEELKARSKTARQLPQLVLFAREFSPTGAAKAAEQQGFSKPEAQSCRYLAMLRKLYGEEEFSAFVNGFTPRAKRRLLALAQTVQWIRYIYYWCNGSDKKQFHFSPPDESYISIVSLALREIETLGEEVRVVLEAACKSMLSDWFNSATQMVRAYHDECKIGTDELIRTNALLSIYLGIRLKQEGLEEQVIYNDFVQMVASELRIES